jgi:hypothetical protein
MRLMNRREFNGLCVALCSCVAASDASAVEPASGAASSGASRTVKFPTGAVVPTLGQGSWHLGQGRHPAAEEEEALRTGLSLGMTLIDTSGNYGEGRSEELIKGVIAGQRDRAFVVSKVEANQVTGNAMALLVTEASLVSVLIISISICCTGQFPTPSFPALWRGSKVYARRAKFVPGACPTSQSAKWKTYSVFHKGIAARPIRSLIASGTAPSNVTYCHGASSMVCR